jgi:hypothetical protein
MFCLSLRLNVVYFRIRGFVLSKVEGGPFGNLELRRTSKMRRNYGIFSPAHLHRHVVYPDGHHPAVAGPVVAHAQSQAHGLPDVGA